MVMGGGEKRDINILSSKLQLNEEIWITESGTWTVPLTGWYDILAIDGGSGGCVYVANNSASAGASGAIKQAKAFFTANQILSITIGAGGIGYIRNNVATSVSGGDTTIEGVEFLQIYNKKFLCGGFNYRSSTMSAYSLGGGFGGKNAANTNFSFYGAGGGASFSYDGTRSQASNGDPGAVRIRWHNPNKIIN